MVLQGRVAGNSFTEINGYPPNKYPCVFTYFQQTLKARQIYNPIIGLALVICVATSWLVGVLGPMVSTLSKGAVVHILLLPHGF